jgi:hypothetical protein
MPTPNDYSRVTFGSSQESYRTHSEETGGESGQVDPTLVYPPTSTDQLPVEGDPKRLQVSSDKASTPEAMAAETDESQSAFAELQHFLNNDLQTAGSRVCHPLDKPWTPPNGSGTKGESY